MATKEEIIKLIKESVDNGSIKKEEIIDVLQIQTNTGGSDLNKKLGIADILYYIGGAIVFFGIAIFVTQNWSSLGTITRILSTLGAAVAAYFAAIFLGVRKQTENVSLAFHFIAALVMPIGLAVTFYEAGFNMETNGMQSLISIILLMVYLLSFIAFRKIIFVFFSIIFSTWLFFSFTSFMIEGANTITWIFDFTSYRVMAAGLAYILLGYYFSGTKQKSLSGFLYGFGILGFLGATMVLQGWKPDQKIFWEIIYPGLIFATLFLSVYLKSRSFLTFGTLFLMAYISKITAEYFSGSMGWPLSLVIIGLLLIASGYLFIYIKNKYLPKKA